MSLERTISHWANKKKFNACAGEYNHNKQTFEIRFFLTGLEFNCTVGDLLTP